jgi:hypothetical protein
VRKIQMTPMWVPVTVILGFGSTEEEEEGDKEGNISF